MKVDYDVIVVGAGPAGSVCAHCLGKDGFRVLLIDKAQFPRDKPCGDFISARLCDEMKQHGLFDAVERLPHTVIDDLFFSHPTIGGFYLRNALNREVSSGLVCKREHLDVALFEEAKKHVDVLEGVKVKRLLIEDGKVVGVESKNKTFGAKIVVGADGANGITAKALGMGALDENHNAVAIRSYYSNVKGVTNNVELHFLDQVQPGYFWIFPLNQRMGEVNVGLGILSRNVRDKNLQLKQLLDDIISEHPQFRDRFTEAKCLAPTKGWSLPFGSKKRTLAFDGAVLVGDAAGLIDPMSGEGIENAFRSSKCASAIIKEALTENNFSHSFLRKYEKALEKILRPELRKGYVIQYVTRNPTFLKLTFSFLKYSRAGRRIIANKFF